MVARALNLSGEQIEAVRLFGSDIGLSASAGSGKTTVLVEKYLEALKAHGCSPQNILAVTFTDKAAGSMKKRLMRRCRDLNLHGVARELENAWIGTLHSFCARVLRENPIECGVDPKFQILAQGEQDLRMREISETLFQEHANDAEVKALLVDMNESSLVAGMRALYDADRAFARDPKLLDTPLFANERKELERLMSAHAADLDKLFSAQNSLSASQVQQRRYSQELQRCLGQLKEPSWERWSRVRDCLDEFDLRSPKTRSAVSALKEAGERWSSLELQALGASAKRTLIRLFEKFRLRYETQKREKGSYDFEDLLFLTHRAFSGPSDAQKALRSRYQKQFEAIFVDEYQDTSQLQASILDLIKRPANLFVVGDSLQSIYGFRHATPELFDAAMVRSARLELRENYRSRQEILMFVNTLFDRLLSGRFTPMIPMRQHAVKKEACIEWVSVPREQGIDLDVFRVWEARTLAGRIRKLVDSGFEVEGEGGPRPMKYKDIAILFRKTTSSRIFEKELEERGIPYFVQKGKGFFERLEIKDLIQMLRVIDNPHADIPLAAALRSPMFQVSDDALFWLAKARRSPEESFYDAVCRWESVKELADKDRNRIRVFISHLTELREKRERATVSRLLREVLDRTVYEAKLMTQTDGDLAQANVQKMLEMAELHEENSAAGLNEFVRYVQHMSESEEAEPEARLIGEEEDVVRILTIHAAKGLEFPCVILADLGGKYLPSTFMPFGATPEFGLGLKVRIKNTFLFEEDYSLAQLRAERERKEEEEQIRLLYVAMTRAKDHLILSGVGSASSWTEKLSTLIGVENAGTAAEVQFGGIPIKIVPVDKKKQQASILSPKRWIDDLGSYGISSENSEVILEKLKIIQKPYQMLEDITVSDVLSVATHEEELEMPISTEAENDEEIPRNEYGTLFHKLMELSVRSSKRGFVSPGLVERLTRTLSPAQKNEMEKSFMRFWNTPEAKEIVLAPRVYSEIPFIYKTPYGLLKGQIDLLYENSKGQWIVLDYKTNRLKEDEAARVAKRYEWQLGLYALVFRDLYGKTPHKGMLYFSSINKFTETCYTIPMLEQLSEELIRIYPKAAFPD